MHDDRAQIALTNDGQGLPKLNFLVRKIQLDILNN